MKIILTGATGTLGSRILFSIFEQKFEKLEKVYLLVRPKAANSPQQRIQNMLASESIPEFIHKNSSSILDKIEVIDAKKMLEPTSYLQGENIDYFIHSAGYVNLSTNPSAKKEVFQENFDFTKDIFNSYSDRIDKFVYISTAFSFGDVGGVLKNNYTENHTGNYRNYYEASKHASEEFLLEQGKVKNIPVQILRPSVLGGNIEEAPNFFISKYMVFYLFAKFFNNNTSDESIRISTNTFTGLNIIPTDYAANVIVKVLETDIEQLNIVHAEETNMMKGISKVLDAVGFSNFSFTDEQITAATGFASKLEEFYYETIGVHLHPYLNSKPSEWDTKLLESILPMPSYNLEDYLLQTVSFAKAANFRNQKW
ncbi:NAD-dependent epimerase/dehydratase family protein [Maribacter algarum]|uniref:NAD-dependent epimerase/dehydratase family protein n=1 Tax=Maribacter algarum (ex Zhang et al. 2020) TaxID=2578118 RepID=A0A5S3PWE1_9FLAO|nr:SDR family oxidoreductase [Maribacter algarum]TMM59319.1 NAD-dependent epimerase/dehydratase family protein [Maribacter algarum]